MIHSDVSYTRMYIGADDTAFKPTSNALTKSICNSLHIICILALDLIYSTFSLY